MNPQQVIAVLGYTFSTDSAQRNQAEELIRSLPSVEGAPLVLLQIVGNSAHCQREVRQAAAIAFKNIAKTNWEPLGRGAGQVCLPAHSKPELRKILFQCLLAEADKPCRDLLAESVNQIARCDYPDLWPQLLPDILSHVQSGEPLRIHNSLLALRQVVKRLEYKNAENGRASLEAIICTALPLLLQLSRQLVETNNNSLEAAMILKLCLKVLWSCTQFALPAACAKEGVGSLGPWLDLLGAVIAKPLPEASENLEPAGQPTVAEERNVRKEDKKKETTNTRGIWPLLLLRTLLLRTEYISPFIRLTHWSVVLCFVLVIDSFINNAIISCEWMS